MRRGVGSFALVQNGFINMETPGSGGPCRLVVKSSCCGLWKCSEKPEVRILPGTSFFHYGMVNFFFLLSGRERGTTKFFGMGLG